MALAHAIGDKVDELKVILKADFRGSIEAIRKELEKLQHEEVRVRLLHKVGADRTAQRQHRRATARADCLAPGISSAATRGRASA
jgi:translation initiation factor IF-2